VESMPDLASILAHPIKPGGNKGLGRVNAARAVVTSLSELVALREDPNVLYVEDDALVYPLSLYGELSATADFTSGGEDYPYGVVMARADTPIAPWPARSSFPSTSACSSGDSFKIAIIDSGGKCA